MAEPKESKMEGMVDKVKKKGFEISVDSDMLKTAKQVASKVFKRKKKTRASSRD